MQGRPGGQHIIDDDIARRGVDGPPFGDDECSSDIAAAFLATEFGLRGGLVLLTQERIGAAPGDQRGQSPGDPFGLIIPAVAATGGVERYRNQDRPRKVATEHLVFDGGGGQVVGEEGATSVFNAVDNPAGGTAGAEGADCTTKGGVQVEAVGAGPVTFKEAFKRVATAQAAGVVNPEEPGCAGRGEMPPGLLVHRLLRDRAIPGKDQIEKPTVKVGQPASHKTAADCVCPS